MTDLVDVDNHGTLDQAKEVLSREGWFSPSDLAPPATGMKLVPVEDLQEIAKQHLPAELTYEARRNADFEGAYDIIVSKARAMLAAVTVKP